MTARPRSPTSSLPTTTESLSLLCALVEKQSAVMTSIACGRRMRKFRNWCCSLTSLPSPHLPSSRSKVTTPKKLRWKTSPRTYSCAKSSALIKPSSQLISFGRTAISLTRTTYAASWSRSLSLVSFFSAPLASSLPSLITLLRWLPCTHLRTAQVLRQLMVISSKSLPITITIMLNHTKKKKLVSNPVVLFNASVRKRK